MKSAHRARAALLGLALAASTPASASSLPAGFVHLSQIDPTIQLDIRYAGLDNFLGRAAKGYQGESCILTEKAAKALARVQEELRPHGMSLVVFDCYRPVAAVADFVSWTREGGPADPRWHPNVRRDDLIRQGYIALRSAHSRGSTVDVGLVLLEPAAAIHFHACGATADEMPPFGTGFDCFDPASRTSSTEVGRDARANRATLVEAMDRGGFRNYSAEWWHFTLRGEPHPRKTFDFPVTAP